MKKPAFEQLPTYLNSTDPKTKLNMSVHYELLKCVHSSCNPNVSENPRTDKNTFHSIILALFPLHALQITSVVSLNKTRGNCSNNIYQRLIHISSTVSVIK
uniref:Uncharacterized protein n=1 Tax=Onchocerca volvulus TaxID=6282 RepID=A0A8R1TWR3_ONCVO